MSDQDNTLAKRAALGNLYSRSMVFLTVMLVLHAPDAEMAIKNARDVYTRRNEGISIWAVEATKVTASSPTEKGPMYEPSQSKVYRHPTFFDIPDDVGAM